LKVRKSLMYPECVNNDGPDNEFIAPRASSLGEERFADKRLAPGPHFIPGFVRRRPLRAVLLAAAVFAIPYSLARHQGHEPAPITLAPAPAGALNALPMGPVAVENSHQLHTTWDPPIGVDRSNEALDQLTMDLTKPQTPDQAPRFRAGPRPEQRPAAAAQPAPAKEPSPEAPAAEAPAKVAEHDAGDHDVTSHDMTSHDVSKPSHDITAPFRTAKARPLGAVDEYLWSVYQRSKTKRDSSGDFTWKDEAAAARLGLVTRQYVIDGMDPDFRELLYNLGHAMDADGIHWTILSGFRDDYRQGLASGYKAHAGNSFHGGSRATGGYGHGCAADIEASDGESGDDNAVWRWVDQHGEKFGIFRPMKGIDPAHVQPTGNWHDVAFNLRDKRETAEQGYLTASVSSAEGQKVTPLVDTRSGVSEAQFDCVRSHHSDFRMANLSHRQRFGHGFSMHRAFLMHPGRMHRYGRRRIVVEIGRPDRRASAESTVVAEEAGTKAVEAAEKHVKGEASSKNRRDARRSRTADVERLEKHPGRESSLTGGGGRQDPKVADNKRADSKHAQKHAMNSASRQTKAARAKSNVHVADEPDASDKKL
jgi:hypothetical protein